MNAQSLPGLLRQLEVHSATRDPVGRAALLQTFASRALAAKDKLPYLKAVHDGRATGVLSQEEWHRLFSDIAQAFCADMANGSVYGASHF